jgi:hypothetical protein
VNAQGKSNDSPFPSEPFIASLEKGEMPRFIPTSVLNPSREKAETGLGKDVEDWILNNNAPVFSEFTASNFRKLGKLGKLLVIAIIDPSNETTAGFIDGVQYVARSIISEKSIKATGGDVVENDANPNRPDISDQYVFGSLDGVHWAEFIEQFNIFNNELPRLVVLDMPKEVFFEDPSVDELDEIDTFLHEVYDGKIPAQKEGMKGSMNRFFSKITSMGWRFYLLAVPFIIALIGAFVVPTSTDKDKYQ